MFSHYYYFFLVSNSNFIRQKSVYKYIWTYIVYNYICFYIYMCLYIYLYIFLYKKFFIEKSDSKWRTNNLKKN